jgi:hypothetical protein
VFNILLLWKYVSCCWKETTKRLTAQTSSQQNVMYVADRHYGPRREPDLSTVMVPEKPLAKVGKLVEN